MKSAFWAICLLAAVICIAVTLFIDKSWTNWIVLGCFLASAAIVVIAGSSIASLQCINRYPGAISKMMKYLNRKDWQNEPMTARAARDYLLVLADSITKTNDQAEIDRWMGEILGILQESRSVDPSAIIKLTELVLETREQPEICQKLREILVLMEEHRLIDREAASEVLSMMRTDIT